MQPIILEGHMGIVWLITLLSDSVHSKFVFCVDRDFFFRTIYFFLKSSRQNMLLVQCDSCFALASSFPWQDCKLSWECACESVCYSCVCRMSPYMYLEGEGGVKFNMYIRFYRVLLMISCHTCFVIPLPSFFIPSFQSSSSLKFVSCWLLSGYLRERKGGWAVTK